VSLIPPSFTYNNIDIAYHILIYVVTSAAKVYVSIRKVSKFLKPLGTFIKKSPYFQINMDC